MPLHLASRHLKRSHPSPYPTDLSQLPSQITLNPTARNCLTVGVVLSQGGESAACPFGRDAVATAATPYRQPLTALPV